MKEKIRIGIIGTGFAKTVQIPAFRNIDGAEIVSVASANLENAERVARDFGIAHFTDDWRETIESKDVDLICITTPPVFHREMTLLALETRQARFVRKTDGDERRRSTRDVGEIH